MFQHIREHHDIDGTDFANQLRAEVIHDYI
jgi:hypothetical protein